ncbi:MAG: hypothetical protein GOP50_07805 [Candidatus Heimdallarchaeota archaeon]|nr:hypothetical protein [Candidatus Heimdallarchaeota archaeon]
MKYPKVICLTLVLSFLFTPFVNDNLTPISGELIFTENWDYKGVVNQQSHRVKYIPIFPTDGVTKSVIEDPYRLRTFIFFLDDIEDNDTNPDSIVALHGINEIRNAPLASLFWEEPAPGAEYGFNVSAESGIEWIDVWDDSPIVNSSSSQYNQEIDFIYRRVLLKAIAFVSNPFLFDGLDLIVPVHIAYLLNRTGVVGHWQQINKDQTIINGNFTTYGPDNPIFVGPTHDPYPEDEWWPNFNITVAQNVDRTSRPRTHSLEVDFQFISVLATIGITLTIFTLIKRIRRIKR